MKGKAGPRPTETVNGSSMPPNLPGMEDREIKPLQEAGLKYAAIRDERQRLNKQEVELKKTLLELMQSHEKDHYEYDGVTIDKVVVKETVKVRVRKDEDDD